MTEPFQQNGVELQTTSGYTQARTHLPEDTAREGHASTYVLDVCPGVLQLFRDFLSLFITKAKKSEAFLPGHCRYATDVLAFRVPVFVIVQT